MKESDPVAPAPGLGAPDVKNLLSFQSPAATRNESEIELLVKSKNVPRLTVQQVHAQNALDAEVVAASLRKNEKIYFASLNTIVGQLETFFSGISFNKIDVVKNEDTRKDKGATAQKIDGRTCLTIDVALLNKPDVHLALIIAHEWAHLVKGHLENESNRHETYEKECDADYEAGKFLGAHGYDLDLLLKAVLSMPENNDPAHGTVFHRAVRITEGFYHGEEMRKTADTKVKAKLN